MERGRVMLSRLLFYFTGGGDNRRRGQRAERTAGVVDSWEYNGRGQREEHEEWTAGVVDSWEYTGRRGQQQWWKLKRAVCTFKRASLIKRDVLIKKGCH